MFNLSRITWIWNDEGKSLKNAFPFWSVFYTFLGKYIVHSIHLDGVLKMDFPVKLTNAWNFYPPDHKKHFNFARQNHFLNQPTDLVSTHYLSIPKISEQIMDSTDMADEK